MKKKTKSKAAAVPQIDPYLEGLMAKLLDRLVSLETKMDTVIAQTAARPSGGNTSNSSNSGSGNNNNRGNNGGGNGNSQQPKPFQHSDSNHPPRRERILFEAICADCHQACEVPFRPSAERAVYCKECFSIRKSGGNAKNFSAPTPVAVPPKAAVKLQAAELSAMAVSNASPKSKNSPPAKKAKKKK